MKHQWNGEIPSPGGKVARRKPGRMRNGDAVGQGMHPNKTDKGFGFNHFYGVHRNILLFAVPHQSPKSVPKCRFGRQLYELRCDCHWQSIDFDSLRGAPPPGEAMGAAAPIRYTTVNVLTKADSLNYNLSACCMKSTCTLYNLRPSCARVFFGAISKLRQILVNSRLIMHRHSDMMKQTKDKLYTHFSERTGGKS